MGVRVLATSVVLLMGTFGILGCSIQVPDGVFTCLNDVECPPGFRCHVRAGEHRCVRGVTPAADGGDVLRPDVGPAVADGGDVMRPDVGPAADGGDVMRADVGVDAAADGGDVLSPVENTAPAAPTLHGFTTSGATALDGFEKGARVCTSNGLYCVTGAFEP